MIHGDKHHVLPRGSGTRYQSMVISCCDFVFVANTATPSQHRPHADECHKPFRTHLPFGLFEVEPLPE